jgi:DNA gyrase subunit A
LIGLRGDERIAGFQAVRGFSDTHYLVFATAKGIVKKTVLSAYGNPRATGINAIKIDAGDELIDVLVTDGSNDIVLASQSGMSIRFNEKDVREMGRTAAGVRGIALEKDDRVIGMVVLRRDATLLVVSEHGMGKRSKVADYRVQKRGGKGIITLKRTAKTGSIVALKEVLPDDELMMITRHGVIIRLPVDGIRVIGRNTQGVKVMNLDSGDTVVDVARVVNEDDAAPDEPVVISEGQDQREMDV